jgi:prevent-host-death family protein
VRTVSITNAKTRWSDLVSSVIAGEAVRITRYGKPVARLTAIEEPRVPVDLAELRALSDSLPRQTETAGAFVRAMRHTDRY